MRRNPPVGLAVKWLLTLSIAGAMGNTACAEPVGRDEGIRFTCSPQQLPRMVAQMDDYLQVYGIRYDQVVRRVDPAGGTAVYTLATPDGDFNTLDLKERPEYGIRAEVVRLPGQSGEDRQVETVSKKEILLALLQHGRLTEFAHDACDIAPLVEHVGIRQNIVAWAEKLEWEWPDGGPAAWNIVYWLRGTPKPHQPLEAAFMDAFQNQKQYAVGCYTATKLVVVQGILDYYARVHPDPEKLQLAKHRLLLDADPLVDIEPGRMWEFEKDFDPQEAQRPGKLLKIQNGIASKNYVPGDWTYFLNTDAATYEKTGYEGSNAIYLGRNRFDDYYNDNEHSYTFEQKLDEVYQWRHGVFSRSRDANKIVPLRQDDYDRLARTPAHNGLALDLRVAPYFFGYERMPHWHVNNDHQVAQVQSVKDRVSP